MEDVIRHICQGRANRRHAVGASAAAPGAGVPPGLVLLDVELRKGDGHVCVSMSTLCVPDAFPDQVTTEGCTTKRGYRGVHFHYSTDNFF